MLTIGNNSFLLQAGKTSAAPPAAEAAPASNGNGRKLDLKDLRFKVVTEFIGINAGQMSRVLPSGWDARSHGDCSHGMGHYSGYFYQVASPELPYNEGSFDNIRQALTALQQHGAQLGDRTGALKVLVTSTNGQIDVDTLREVYRMHQSIDPIMYSIGQNGNGYHVGQHSINTTAPQLGSVVDSKCPNGNYYFCEPTSNNQDLCKRLAGAKNVTELETALTGADRYGYSGKHWGFLPRNRSSDSKFTEFRYFTNTFDADAVRADVEAALGIIKCAHEGRWPQGLPNQPMGNNQPPQVDWRVFNAFNTEVMRGLAKPDLTQKYFTAGSGKVAPPPISKEDVGRLTKMQGDGYHFEFGGGNLESAISAQQVKVTEPGQNFSYDVPGSQFLKFMSSETGGGEAVSDGAQGLAHRQQELRAAGVRFFAAGCDQPIGSLHGPAAALAQGRLEAQVDGNRVPVKDRDAFEQVAWQVLGAKYPAEIRQSAEAAIALRAKGYKFSSADGDKKLISPLGIARALTGKGLGMRLPESKKTTVFTDAAQAGAFIQAESGNLEAIPEDQRHAMALATDLRTTGYEFAHADGKIDNHAQLLVPQALADGKLTYKAPGAAGSQPFKGDFVHWAGATLGREGALTMADKQLLEHWSHLQNGGAVLTDAAGNQSKRSLISQVLGGETVYVKLPGGQPQPFGKVADLSAYIDNRNGMPASLPGESGDALTRLYALRDERNLNVASNGTPLTTSQQVAWSLSDNRPITLTQNGAGNALTVNDFASLQSNMAMETDHKDELPEDAQKILTNLGRLSSKNVQFYSTNGNTLTWKSQQTDAVKGGTLKAKLAKRVWWNFWPRKDITVKSEAALAKLANKVDKK